METKFKAKIFTNKKNGQQTLLIPKKFLKFPKNKNPKFMELKIEKIEW